MRIDKSFVGVVTGGTSGLGKATVQLLTSLGANVVIADLDEKNGKVVAEQTKAHFFKTDVTDQAQVKALFEYTKQTFGKVDAVVCSAGVGPIASIITSKGVASSQVMQKTFKINVLGTFNAAKFAAKTMSEQTEVNGERGVIILVSSGAGTEGQKGQSIYGATKGAINGMVLPLARDLGKYKIRVMAIAPGIFLTPIIDMLSDSYKKKIQSQTPSGRFGKVEQFAKLTQSIIENSYANGTIWRIDGASRLPYI